MKKRLVTGLIFALILCFNFVVFAEHNFTVDKYVADTIYSLGIVDDSIPLDKTMTRAEFSRVAINLKKISQEEGKDSKPIFYDVDMNNEYYCDINLAATYGLIYGDGYKYFYPSKPITVDEAIRICVRILGISDKLDANYQSIASGEKLYKNLPIATQTMTYENAIQLAFNVLNASNFSQDINSLGVVRNGIFMQAYWEVMEVKGQVTANEWTGLRNINNTKEGYIRIEGTDYKANLENIKEFLGYSVNAYVRYVESSDEYEIISIEKNSNNEEITVNAKDILDETTVSSFVYKTENGRKKEISLASPDFIYNGVHFSPYTTSDLNIDKGTVTLIDSNSDKIYDVVKVEEYKDIFVSAVDVESMKIYDQYGEPEVDLYDKNVELKTPVGGKFKISSLKKDSVVSVFESKSAGTKCVRVIMSITPTVTGAVKCVEATESETILNIDDTEYILDSNYNLKRVNYPGKMPPVVVGTNATFHLNHEGIIVAVVKETSDIKYGFMTKLRPVVDDTGEDVLKFKIFSEDGEFVECYATKKIKINGIRMDSLRLLDDSAIYTTSAVPQLIRFKLNDEQKLTTIEYATGGNIAPHLSTSETLVKNATLTNATFKSGTKLEHQWIFTGNSLIFLIPEDLEYEDGFGFQSKFTNDVTMSTPIHIYNANKSYFVECAVIRNSSSVSFGNERYLSMIKKITTSLNEDDEILPYITYVKQGTEYSCYAKNDSIVQVLGKGDLVQLALDDKGMAKGIKLIFKNGSTPNNPLPYTIYKDKFNYKSPGNTKGNYDDRFYSSLVCVYGKCLGNNNGIISVTGFDNSGSVYPLAFETESVYILDTDECTITKATYQAIVESASYTNLNGSTLLTNARNDLGREVYIIK